MKINGNNFYIFWNKEELYNKVEIYLSNGYRWLFLDSTFPYIPPEKFPITLNCDSDRLMMWSEIKQHKEAYFSDENFVKLYNQELRKRKIKNLKL